MTQQHQHQEAYPSDSKEKHYNQKNHPQKLKTNHNIRRQKNNNRQYRYTSISKLLQSRPTKRNNSTRHKPIRRHKNPSDRIPNRMPETNSETMTHWTTQQESWEKQTLTAQAIQTNTWKPTMDYRRHPGDPARVLPITKYKDVKQTFIKRLELALTALQGIPNRPEQEREIYGSLSTQAKPPGPNLQHQQESKYFKMSGNDSKDFYIQYFPISYDQPPNDPEQIKLKTWGHAQINLDHFPPQKNPNLWTQIHAHKLQFNVADGYYLSRYHSPPKHIYRLKEMPSTVFMQITNSLGYAHLLWNNFAEEESNNWTTYCIYLSATNPQMPKPQQQTYKATTTPPR